MLNNLITSLKNTAMGLKWNNTIESGLNDFLNRTNTRRKKLCNLIIDFSLYRSIAYYR